MLRALICVALVVLPGSVWSSTCSNANYIFYPQSDECYRFFATASHISQARFSCLNDNASLPIVLSASDNAALTLIGESTGTNPWLALYCRSPDVGSCVWDSGEPLTYENFYADHPNVTFGNCVFLDTAGNGKWQSTDCKYDYKSVVCTSKPTSPAVTGNCPGNFTLGNDNRCYTYIVQTQDYATSEATCRGLNSTLPIYHEQQSLDALVNYTASVQISVIRLGLQYNATDNYYVWADGSSDTTIILWKSGNPNVNQGDCVVTFATGSYRKQSQNFPCSAYLPTICVASSTLPTTSPVTTPTASSIGDCPLVPYYHSTGNALFLTSPNYPEYYGTNLSCAYHLSVSAGCLVKIIFVDFELNLGDSVAVYNGDQNAQANLIANFTSGQANGNTTFTSTTAAEILLVFSSAHNATGLARGWELTFSPVPPSGEVTLGSLGTPTPGPGTWTSAVTYAPSSCNASTYYYNNGTITSPGYPGNYSNNLECSYFLTAPVEKKVQIDFDFIQTEDCCDHIVLYDGPSSSSSVIATLSGDYPGISRYTSTSQYLTAVFTTDSQITGKGFLANYYSV